MTSNRESFGHILNTHYDNFINSIDNFRKILPNKTGGGASSSGEEGRYAESMLMEFLRKNLPDRLAVATGFVVDLENELKSYQIDILVYDCLSYSPYLQYGEAVVVPQESLVAAISVKKNLKTMDISHEVERLSQVGGMCGALGKTAPYLSIFAFQSKIIRTRGGKKLSIAERVQTAFDEIAKGYPDRYNNYSTNELIDSLIILGEFYIKKESASSAGREQVFYLWSGSSHEDKNRSRYLQELIHGVNKSVRGDKALPGSPPSPSNFPKADMSRIGPIPVVLENRPYQKPDARKMMAHARRQQGN